MFGDVQRVFIAGFRMRRGKSKQWGTVRFDRQLRHSGTGSILSNGAGGEVVRLQVRNSRGIVKSREDIEKNTRPSEVIVFS